MSDIVLYNSMTRRKEAFEPQSEKQVKMYVCGPTVYNYIHIGNARPFVIFDTVRRYLEYKGYDVCYVQNITDVDDKIINKSNEENTTMKEVADRYIKELEVDVKGLNIKTPTHTPRVTEEIESIIKMINQLVEKGFAYEKNGTVYFDTKAFNEYGKLSHKNMDEFEFGSRVAVDADKNAPTDFVLWKPNKPNEPKWDSPWGDGRPGWHIECSAMAQKYLGDSIDIHAGGEDLIFPHHENEIAQSEAVTGKPFAKYWMHNAFLNVDNKKMSKSLGNFFTLREISEKYPYEVIRFFIISGHYRSPINFSDELLQAAENSLNRIKNCVKNLKYSLSTLQGDLSGNEKELLPEIDGFQQDFEKAMNDDFNTADAITAIFELVKFANIHVNENASKAFAQAVYDKIILLSNILGMEFEQEDKVTDEDKINALIQRRTEAKKNKDYATADAIRAELNDMNIVIEDTPSGVRWFVKS